MKFRDLLISAAAAAMATFAAGAAGAAVITDTFTFTATGFQSAFGQAVPTDPVTGSFTVTFDPTQTYFNQTAGITMNSLNLTLDSSAVSFNYSPTATSFSDGSALDAGELIIGGAELGAALVQTSPTTQNDFYVHIDDALTAPVMQQLGYTSSALGPQAYFFTPAPESITVTPVPEPAAWLLMIAGIGCIGGALRMSRKADGLRSLRA